MKVCVIGAGIGGISATKACIEGNLEVVCYEKYESIGGIWSHSKDSTRNGSHIMNDTITNTSKEITAFSDFPMPDDFPNYLHHTKYLDYLESYCQNFHLYEHIRFRCEVLDVKMAEDYDTSGRWVVTVKKLSLNEIEESVFDAVIVCNGVLQVPFCPKNVGREDFKGKIKHNLKYGNKDDYKKENVLVVGSGNSACDIAVDLSTTAKKVYLSSRNGLPILTRISKDGLPLDLNIFKRFSMLLTNVLPSYFAQRALSTLVNQHANQSIYGTGSTKGLDIVMFIFNDMLISRILSGRITVKGPVHKIVPTGVIFKDEDTITDIDTVIYGTGYFDEAKFLQKSITLYENNHSKLYKSVFPWDLKHPTLAFVACVRTNGPLGPLSEIQSRWIVQVLKQNYKLPTAQAMRKRCKIKDEKIMNSVIDFDRYNLFVDWFQYIEEISSEIGAAPRVLRYCLTDPRLGFSCLFGSVTPFQYRLNGPNSWPGARHAVLTVHQRVRAAFNTGAHYHLKNKESKKYFWFKLSIVICVSYGVYSKAKNYIFVMP